MDPDGPDPWKRSHIAWFAIGVIVALLLLVFITFTVCYQSIESAIAGVLGFLPPSSYDSAKDPLAGMEGREP